MITCVAYEVKVYRSPKAYKTLKLYYSKYLKLTLSFHFDVYRSNIDNTNTKVTGFECLFTSDFITIMKCQMVLYLVAFID